MQSSIPCGQNRARLGESAVIAGLKTALPVAIALAVGGGTAYAQKNPCAGKKNPCAAQNPCAAKKNPCAAKKNPCGANPCAAKKK